MNRTYINYLYLRGSKASDLTAQELCISLLETAELFKGVWKNIFKGHLKNESLHMPNITAWRLGKAKKEALQRGHLALWAVCAVPMLHTIPALSVAAPPRLVEE